MNKIIFFISIIIFFIFMIFFRKKETENYINYYIPFNKRRTNLYNMYLNKDYKKTKFENNFYYKAIKFGYTLFNSRLSKDKNSDLITTLLGKLLLANYNVKYIRNIYYKNNLFILKALNNYKINFGYLPALLVEKQINEMNKINLINNIRFIATIHKLTYFIITKKKNNIKNITFINNRKRIGLDFKDSVTDIITKKLFEFMELKKNIDYKIKYFNYNLDIMNKLVNDEIDIAIITNIFPDKKLTKIFDDTFVDPLTLIPLENFNLNLFLKKEPLIQTEFIDLNKISDVFLPTYINDNYYQQFKPNFKTISCYFNLYTNDKTNEKLISKMINLLFMYKKVINEKLGQQTININKFTDYYSNNILLSNSTTKFLKEKGLINQIDNPNCKYLIGKMPCTIKNLKKNNLLFN